MAGGAAWTRRLFGVLLCMTLVGNMQAAWGAIDYLKAMPPKGSVRQGEVVYVDDGSCPAGEVKKITGGNQMTGVPRQVECVKKPAAGAQP